MAITYLQKLSSWKTLVKSKELGMSSFLLVSEHSSKLDMEVGREPVQRLQ